jgi:hypothetical protein
VLVFGLIGMHNLVAPGGTPHPVPGPMAVPTIDNVDAAMSRMSESEMDMPECCPDHDLAGDHSGPAPGHRHTLLHLCLAVLAALTGLALTSLLSRRAAATAGGRLARSMVTRVRRGPPPTRPPGDLLTSLRVLRL